MRPAGRESSWVHRFPTETPRAIREPVSSSTYAAGIERFGLGLQESGRLVMGLDAPPGKGDDRNRERITLVADESGGSSIRFLDCTTSIPARLYLDDQNRVWLEFIGTQTNEVVRRRIGLSGDETTRTPR